MEVSSALESVLYYWISTIVEMVDGDWSIIFSDPSACAQSNFSGNQSLPSWSNVHFQLHESRIFHAQEGSSPIYENWTGRVSSCRRETLQGLKAYSHRGRAFFCWKCWTTYFATNRNKGSIGHLLVRRNEEAGIWRICWPLGTKICLSFHSREKQQQGSTDRPKPLILQ